MQQFSDLKIIVPLPPRSWFGGHDLELAASGISVFRELGAAVATVSADDWDHPENRAQIVSRLEEFEPTFAIGVPNAGYGLYFSHDDQGTGDSLNLFTDILSIPLVLLWDHLLTQAPSYHLRSRLSENPVRPGALRELSRKLENRFNRHYVPDTGHAEIYEALGIIGGGQTRSYVPCAMDHFVEYGKAQHLPSIRNRVGFAGNIYASQSSKLDILGGSLIRSIDEAILRGKHEHWEESGWNLLCQALDQLSDQTIYDAGLNPDYPFFWKVARDLLSYRVSTAHRLDVLDSIAYPIDFYGNFAEPEGAELLGRPGHINYRGSADYTTELPKVFGSYEVWVDVTNAPFIRGCGAKVLNCFAAGSLMLIDYREDLHGNIGELAEHFMFRNPEDLNEKLERFLAHPKERLEIVRAMQEIIRGRLTWSHLSAQLCSEILISDRASPASGDSNV